MSDGICGASSVDPEDWFIGRDGKQYPDDEFLTEAERRGLTRSVLPISGETAEAHQERVDGAVRAAEADRRRRALQRRRKAREACYSCPLRGECLDQALREGQNHGTWGGYYEEELREIQREISRRKRVRNSPE